MWLAFSLWFINQSCSSSLVLFYLFRVVVIYGGSMVLVLIPLPRHVLLTRCYSLCSLSPLMHGPGKFPDTLLCCGWLFKSLYAINKPWRLHADGIYVLCWWYLCFVCYGMCLSHICSFDVSSPLCVSIAHWKVRFNWPHSDWSFS